MLGVLSLWLMWNVSSVFAWLLVSSRWYAPGGDQSKLDQGLHFFPVGLENNSWGYLVLK
jgi:hypothetical protein